MNVSGTIARYINHWTSKKIMSLMRSTKCKTTEDIDEERKSLVDQLRREDELNLLKEKVSIDEKISNSSNNQLRR